MDNVRKLRAALVVAIMGALVGCVAMPSERLELEGGQRTMDRFEDSWFSERPAVSRFGREGELIAQRRHPIPPALGRQQVEFDLYTTATMDDLVEILNEQNLPTVIREDEHVAGNGDDEIEATYSTIGASPARIRKFRGTVQELATILRDLRDVEVEFRGGHLMIRRDATYYIQVPQSQGLGLVILTQIKALGAGSVEGDIDSGLIVYRATPERASSIERYVRHVAANAATVHLQVAVINVRMEESRRQGIDWGTLAMRIGDIPGVAVEQTGRALVFSSRELAEGERAYGLGANIERGNFGLQGVLDALSQYGETFAEQDVTLTTLAGNPVRIETGQEIPYVGELGAAFQGGQGGGVFGQATVDSVNVGLDLTMTPRFDANSELVTTNIDLQISELIAIREFEAGGGGTLTAPELEFLNFTNISRLRPGQVTLLGGVTTNQGDDYYTSITGMERHRFGHQRKKDTRSAIFIMLRPTVTLYSDLAENEVLPGPGDTTPCWENVVLLDRGEHVRRVSSVFFDHGKSSLAREQRHHVWSVVRDVKDNERVAVVGYADPSGAQETNVTLRANRKGAVYDLIAPLVTSVRRVAHTPLYCADSNDEMSAPSQRRAEIWVISRGAREVTDATVDEDRPLSPLRELAEARLAEIEEAKAAQAPLREVESEQGSSDEFGREGEL